jgi:peroxiredoxin
VADPEPSASPAAALPGEGATPAPGPLPRRRRGIGPFSLRQVGLAVGFVVVAGLVLVAVTTPIQAPPPSGGVDPQPTAYVIGPPTVGLGRGEQAPEFEGLLDDGSTFQLADLDGNPIRLADLRGRGVWVTFWTTWCPPCQNETPILRDAYEEYRDRGFELVAVNVQQTVEAASEYAERYGLEYPIGADVSGAVFGAWLANALPTHVLIRPDGTVEQVVIRPIYDAGEMGELIETILPAR